MKVQVFVALLVELGAACSDDPQRITLETGESPALLAFRDHASTEWQTVDTTGQGTFELEVAGPYHVVVACQSINGSVLVSEYARTPSDEDSIEYPCRGDGGFPFVVSGALAQPGRVSLGNVGSSRRGVPSPFHLPAAPGTFDLVAFFGAFSDDFDFEADEVAIRRDIVVTGDLELGLIDAAQDAHAMVPMEFVAASVEPGEALSATLRVQSGNTNARYTRFSHPAQAWDVRLAPDSALRATDRQGCAFSANRSESEGALLREHSRSISREVEVGGPTSITLPEPLGELTFEASGDRLTAAWSSLPAHDQLMLWQWSFAEDFSHDVFHELLLSRSFVDATGGSSATLDLTSIPGFKPEWRQLGFQQTRGFQAIRGTTFEGGGSSNASVTESLDALSAASQRARAGSRDEQVRLRARGDQRRLGHDWFR